VSDPLGLSVDPSGLYLAVSVKNNSIEPEPYIRKKWTIKGDWAIGEGSWTRIIIYEIGTGLVSTELSSLFDVSSFTFSPNGWFFVVGSTNGSVSIWALPEDMIENVQRVLA